ncbi:MULTISPECIES: RtcB family protein [Calothrix]|uniref:RtcB family protein n=1 Tax=Calothrix TaxID=1186 RepID=UPI001F551AA5|nr:MULTISPECIES: RtcB family protein [Calothrix]
MPKLIFVYKLIELEEAPAAYKPIQAVIDVQVEAEMVGVVARLSAIAFFGSLDKERDRNRSLL